MASRPESTTTFAYNLATDAFCAECERFKPDWILHSVPTGCATCDEMITRHRCTGQPDLDSLAVSGSWGCPVCGCVWTAVRGDCHECGAPGMETTWSVVEGDRMDTAPRYEPDVPVKILNRLSLTAEPLES